MHQNDRRATVSRRRLPCAGSSNILGGPSQFSGICHARGVSARWVTHCGTRQSWWPDEVAGSRVLSLCWRNRKVRGFWWPDGTKPNLPASTPTVRSPTSARRSSTSPTTRRSPPSRNGVGAVDHVVSTASARARGNLGGSAAAELAAIVCHQSHRPHHAGQILCPANQPGRLVCVVLGGSCFQAQRRLSGVGITNGAVDFLTRWSAVELAPVRVNSARTASGITSSTSPTATRCGGSAPSNM
jgi:hypothetical protein